MNGQVHRPVLMADLLLTALRRHRDRVLVVGPDGDLTGADLEHETSRYAGALASLGVAPGVVVATLSPNRPELVPLMCAEQVLGSVSTSLHPLGSVDDHSHVVADAGVALLVFDPQRHAERASALSERFPHLRLVSLGPGERATDLAALVRTVEPGPLEPRAVLPTDTARLSYTGGTTGRPKGVVHTHASRAAMTSLITTEWEWPDPLRHLVCTPLSHAGGTVVLPVLIQGGCLVVLEGFDAPRVLAAIERHRITSVMLVPTMIYALLDHADTEERDLSSLQTILYGASPMNPTRLAEAITRFGPVFFQFYGQAESPMALISLGRAEHRVDDLERLASCGRPVRWVSVELLDEDNLPVPDGTPGEICVRGPLTMQEYLGLPEETAAAFAGGWLHTGDVAVRDGEGFLRIVDRKKEMIVSGGFNVFPREVEDVLALHPAVGQVAVIGIPDERWGEAVHAVVVRRPGTDVSVEELTALVREHKGPVQTPKSIEFLASLPTTPVGKPDKKSLRAPHWQGRERQVG